MIRRVGRPSIRRRSFGRSSGKSIPPAVNTTTNAGSVDSFSKINPITNRASLATHHFREGAAFSLHDAALFFFFFLDR